MLNATKDVILNVMSAINVGPSGPLFIVGTGFKR